MAGGGMPNFMAFFTKCFTTFQPTAIARFLLQAGSSSIGSFSTMLRNTSTNLAWYSLPALSLAFSTLTLSFSARSFFRESSWRCLQSFISSLISRHLACRTLTSSSNLFLASFLAELRHSSLAALMRWASSASLLMVSSSLALSSFSSSITLSLSDIFSCSRIIISILCCSINAILVSQYILYPQLQSSEYSKADNLPEWYLAVRQGALCALSLAYSRPSSWMVVRWRSIFYMQLNRIPQFYFSLGLSGRFSTAVPAFLLHFWGFCSLVAC